MKTETNPFQAFSAQEREKIEENAQALAGILQIWASCYPTIRAERIAPVSVLVATVLPNLPIYLSLAVGKLILFIFAIDDLADERILSYAEYKRACRGWAEIARDGACQETVEQDGDLNAVLLEIRSELAQRPLFSDLLVLWTDSLQQLCGAMLKEYEYGLNYTAGQKDALPTLDEYLENGTHSVGFPFWATSLLILLSEPNLERHLWNIRNIIQHTGQAIRLYNDVRTYEKEVKESNINAITLIQSRLGAADTAAARKPSFEKARRTVLDLANQSAEQALRLNRQVQTGSGQFEMMVSRILAFHANFYGSQQHSRDYHTISYSESFGMIQGEC